MKKILPITISAIGIVFTQTLIAQTTISLTPYQDASVGYHQHYNSARNNYGYADYYGAFSQDGAAGGWNSGRGIMEFDLSGIPSGSTIISAKLAMYGRGPWSTAGDAASVGDIGVNRCYLKRITTRWDQYVVTWNTKPGTTDADEVFLHESNNPAENYTNIDVTQLVADMVADPANSFGFEIALKVEKPIRALAFWSTDSPDPSLWPHLTITYTSGASTVTLTPYQDASVGYHQHYNSARNNYGHAIYYGAFSQDGAAGGWNSGRGIMEFDLSGIPGGSTIVSAKLALYGSGPFGAGDAASVGDVGANRCYLKRITTPWDQYVVTWNTKPCTTDADEVFLHESTSPAENYTNIDVTQLVADMIADPANSFGFEIALKIEKPIRALAFWSTDSPDPSLWPHLTITYTSGNSGNPTGVISMNNHNINSSIYPNPVVYSATLLIDASNQQGNLKVNIADLSGKIVRTYNSASNQLSFTREGISDGLYFYEVLNVTGNVISRGKFIIQ